MNRTKMTLLALASLMATAVAMSSCGSICNHMDNDRNQLCDICGASMETAAENVTQSGNETAVDAGSEMAPETAGDTGSEMAPGTDSAKEVRVTITVKDQRSTPIEGAVFHVITPEHDTLVTLTTDADGHATYALFEGEYTVVFETLPEWHLGGTVPLKVTADTAAIDLEVLNNTPDGSEENPFFIGTDTATNTFAAGATLHYTFVAGDRRTLVIENAADIEITLNGTKHLPDENGLIRVPISSQSQQTHLKLAVTSKTAQDVIIRIEVAPGAQDNPLVIEALGSVQATVPKDVVVHYTYTAEKATTIYLRSDDPKNNISMINHTTNAATSFTNGSTEAISLKVEAGDIVSIAVSVLGTDANLDQHTLIFTLEEVKS